MLIHPVPEADSEEKNNSTFGVAAKKNQKPRNHLRGPVTIRTIGLTARYAATPNVPTQYDFTGNNDCILQVVVSHEVSRFVHTPRYLEERSSSYT